MQKKKIIIIGAGVAGLSSGIYALENGYDTCIYEKNPVAGGECISWKRKGQTIDGCAHFIVGTNKSSQLYPLWRHVHAFDDDTVIHECEYFSSVDVDGRRIFFYADIEKLRNELYEISPIDKKQIDRFINGIKTYMYITVPTDRPVDLMGLFKLMGYGLRLLRVVPKLLYYMHISIKKYSMKFKSPIIRDALTRLMTPVYNVHSLFYIFQTVAKGDAGVVEGGSSIIINNMLNHYLSLGGKIEYNRPVDKVLIENNVSKGVILKNNEIIKSDYVISTADAYHTLFNLLDQKYLDSYYIKRFSKRVDNPLPQCIFVSLKCVKNLDNLPKMMNFRVEPFNIGDTTVTYFSIRNFSFDMVICKDGTLLTSMIDVCDSTYDYLKSMDRETYLNEKKRIGDILLNSFSEYFNIDKNSLEVIDVATPLTYERYCNAYRGSYMSFITTPKSKGLMRKESFKGLKNFFIAGQWIMPPGGLPIALFTGKHAALRIAESEKRRSFVDLEKPISELKRRAFRRYNEINS